jgi:hypothetical protein
MQATGVSTSKRTSAGRAPALILVVSFCAFGCADASLVTSLERRTADLEKKTNAQSSEIEKLKNAVTQLEQSRSYDDFMRNIDSIAYLTPGSAGYAVVQTDLGRITVELENVQTYANGSRVTLRFGNLTSATINGAKATLEWGTVDAKGSPDNNGARTREVTFNRSLRAGAWTEVPVVLEGIPPTELGFLRIKEITHTGIVLSK